MPCRCNVPINSLKSTERLNCLRASPMLAGLIVSKPSNSPLQPLRAASSSNSVSCASKTVDRPNHCTFSGISAVNSSRAYSRLAIRFRSTNRIFFCPTRRISSMTQPTGFCKCLRPQAVGATQNSQLCEQDRVASNTAWVRKCRASNSSRRAKGMSRWSEKLGACAYRACRRPCA